MASPNVTIGGVPVLGSSPVKWALRSGTAAVQSQFDVTPDGAASLKDLALGPVSLVIKARGHTLEAKFLYVLNVSGSDNPHVFRATVADRRIWWPYSHVNRGYNVRRRVGFRRITAVDQEAIQPVVPKVWYKQWSMKDQKIVPPDGLWSPKQILRDVIKRASNREKERFGAGPLVVVSEGIKKGIPVEDLMIQDPGDQAVGRVLRYMPEASLFVDLEGQIIVYPKTTGAERNLVKIIGPEKVGNGHISLVENEPVRPSKVVVYFEPEVELRFDYIERDPDRGSTITELEDEREVENVLPLPDYQTTISGEQLPQGTWVTVNQAIAAWNAQGAPPGLGPLTLTMVRRAFVPFMDLWSAIELSGIRVPDADWSARVAAIQEHFRRTFRVTQKWMARIKSLRAYRVAIVDPTSGSRAPAMAWSDYSVLPSQKTLFRINEQGGDLPYIINVKGYPVAGDNLGLGSRLAPAVVSILDADQGIIHVDYAIDPYRSYEAVLPSMVEIEGSTRTGGYPEWAGPIANIRNKQRSITFDSVLKDGTGWPQLTAEHKMAIILTAVPAAPNNERKLVKVEIKPKDIEDLLPAAAAAGLGKASGPPLDVFVGPNVEPARISWKDSRAEDIARMFGVPDQDARPNLAGLVTNLEDQGFGLAAQGASLNAIARAAAARVYASMADRLEGQASGDLAASAQPIGWCEEVMFEVHVNGEAATAISMPEQVPQFPLLSFLDANARAVIMRLAQP